MAPRPPTGLEMLLDDGSADEKYERLRRLGCLSDAGLARRPEVIDLIERTTLQWLRLRVRQVKVQLGEVVPPSSPVPSVPSVTAFWQPNMPIPSYFDGATGLVEPADDVAALRAENIPALEREMLALAGAISRAWVQEMERAPRRQAWAVTR